MRKTLCFYVTGDTTVVVTTVIFFLSMTIKEQQKGSQRETQTN